MWGVLSNRAQNEHIGPASNKLKSKQEDVRKVFDPQNVDEVFATDVVAMNLQDVSVEMKKTLPQLISKPVYQEQKNRADTASSLSIVIDETNNILSFKSSREAKSWKDYRPETFEDILEKDGNLEPLSPFRANAQVKFHKR